MQKLEILVENLDIFPGRWYFLVLIQKSCLWINFSETRNPWALRAGCLHLCYLLRQRYQRTDSPERAFRCLVQTLDVKIWGNNDQANQSLTKLWYLYINIFAISSNTLEWVGLKVGQSWMRIASGQQYKARFLLQHQIPSTLQHKCKQKMVQIQTQ